MQRRYWNSRGRQEISRSSRLGWSSKEDKTYAMRPRPKLVPSSKLDMAATNEDPMIPKLFPRFQASCYFRLVSSLRLRVRASCGWKLGTAAAVRERGEREKEQSKMLLMST